MEGFLDLANLYQQIKGEINAMQYMELELPEAFKTKVTSIGDRSILYHKYTAIAHKENADSIIIPNYWFYLAAKLVPYNKELHRYYDQIIGMNLFSNQRLNELKKDGVALTEVEKSKIDESCSSSDDAEKIKRFLVDYPWWHGGKELGRVQKDYYVSAILSLSGLINDSSSFLAAICEHLRTDPTLVSSLESHYSRNKDRVSEKSNIGKNINLKYRQFITAIKSKPFLLLAGISGTGKSRIVRELARACWEPNSEEFKAQKPCNFEMVQVKPNWHDSSELIGYVSRIDGIHYIVGPFLKFMVKAIKNPTMPYFLCLDEMNLAPVEQYFAEYLSVIESRKVDENGNVNTDPIIDYSSTEEYKSLIDQLFPEDDELRESYLTEEGGKRLCIPNNLIIVGTVNMDETTFSFSRKVLDRAMTIEMNEVNLDGGLDSKYEIIGKLGKDDLIGLAVEGVDVYGPNQGICDKVIVYLKEVNKKLEGTPFKVAYRTRNEFLLYVVNNLPYLKDEKGDDITEDEAIARALDEITSMKILSRIEGDESKVKKSVLEGLKKEIKAQLESIAEQDVFVANTEGETTEEGKTLRQSISLAKLDEMIDRLESGYTSFWA